MKIIKVDGLTRDFEYYEKAQGLRGSAKNLFRREKKIKHAVKSISFDITRGEIVGFLGPNGAGKTTTLKMLSGILHPTSGSATVDGHIPWEREDEYKRMFSFVSGQKTQLWNDLPAIDTFNLNKCIYEIPDDEYKSTLGELCEMLDIKDLVNIQVRRLSLGEKMKMQFAASLLHKPKVLFLDEPTIGLDIMTQQRLRSFIKDYVKNQGVTVILTSHYMKDIEDLCEKTIIISEGSVVYDGYLQDIQSKFHMNKFMNMTFKSCVTHEELSRYGVVVEHDEFKAKLKLEMDSYAEKVAAILNKLPIQDFTIEEPSIEQGIMKLFNNEQLSVDEGTKQ